MTPGRSSARTSPASRSGPADATEEVSRFVAESPDPGGRRPAFKPPFVARPVPCDDAVTLARNAAKKHGLEAGLLIGIMRAESGMIRNAISPARAVGLIQVLPWIGEKLGCGDLFDPALNVDCGARILKDFLAHYGNDVTLGLSAFNAGWAMPDAARKESRVPKNFQYAEDVLRARARWLRAGCKAFERD